MAFGHFLLGSHNLMVTTLGSCVKWSLVAICRLNAYTYEWYIARLVFRTKHISNMRRLD